jgi:hypothetical protein
MVVQRLILAAAMLSVSATAATFGSVLGAKKIDEVVHSVAADVAETHRGRRPTVHISPEFEIQIAKEIADLDAPSNDAEARLRSGFRVFLDGYLKSLDKRFEHWQGGQWGRENVTIAPGEALQTYKNSLRERCPHVVPCPIPPCCGECKDCKK